MNFFNCERLLTIQRCQQKIHRKMVSAVREICRNKVLPTAIIQLKVKISRTDVADFLTSQLLSKEYLKEVAGVSY